jgi:hypothetical protein
MQAQSENTSNALKEYIEFIITFFEYKYFEILSLTSFSVLNTQWSLYNLL